MSGTGARKLARLWTQAIAAPYPARGRVLNAVDPIKMASGLHVELAARTLKAESAAAIRRVF
jgi:hypothetical protein